MAMPYKGGVKASRERCYAKNREKIRKRAKDWYYANRERLIKERTEIPEKFTLYKNRQLKSKYGITAEEYDKLLIDQEGVCAICGDLPNKGWSKGKSKVLCVDHAHETGNIRGLLCGGCNRGLGMFKDNPKLLICASKYLKGKTT